MKTLRASRPRLPIVLCLAFLGATSALTAQDVELPFDAVALFIDLTNADVGVVIDDEATAALRLSTPEGAASPDEICDIVTDAAGVTIRRRADAAGDPRVKLSVVMDPYRQLAVAGRDLVLSIEEAGTPDDDEEDEEDDEDEENDEDENDDEDEESDAEEGEPAKRPTLQLELESSQVNLVGIWGAAIEARNSSIWIQSTVTSLDLDLTGGFLEVREHRGMLSADMTDTEASVLDFRGGMETSLRGGSLDVRGGVGAATVKATDAVLLFESWNGSLDLDGTNTAAEARDSGRGPWKLAGTGLRLIIDGLGAILNAQLDGGSLEGRGFQFKATIGASSRADVELADLVQPVDLKLADGASGRLFEARAVVKAEVNDAYLDVDGVHHLILSGRGADIRAGRVVRLGSVDLAESTLDFDLSGMIHNAALKLQGTSRATVQLTSPCIVRLAGQQGMASDSLLVSGCDMYVPGLTRSYSAGERRPVTLIVDLGEDSELEVDGRP